MNFAKEHPAVAISILTEMAMGSCAKFEELRAKNSETLFCGTCSSCVAFAALMMVEREAATLGHKI